MLEKTTVPYDTMSVNSVSTDRMFSKCCCCIPIRIGCFILGYTNLFFNSIRTLFFVGITLYCGLMTHGFDHIDPPPTAMDEEQTRTVPLDHETIQILGWVLVLMTIFDLIWLVINIVCLVGIHKKRPGHIRTYVGFATFRLIVTMAGYMYQLNSSMTGNPHIVAHCIDLGLSAYFILVYYIYAMRLEKEAREEVQEPEVPQLNDISYIYPTKLDKEHLVVKIKQNDV